MAKLQFLRTENWFLNINREIITRHDEFSSTYYSLEVAAKNPFLKILHLLNHSFKSSCIHHFYLLSFTWNIFTVCSVKKCAKDPLSVCFHVCFNFLGKESSGCASPWIWCLHLSMCGSFLILLLSYFNNILLFSSVCTQIGKTVTQSKERA